MGFKQFHMGNYINKYINFYYFQRDINILSWDFSKNITHETIHNLQQKHNKYKNNSLINTYKLKTTSFPVSCYSKKNRMQYVYV